MHDKTATSPAQGTQGTGSLYEQLGGAATVDKAVEIFYRKVMADGLLRSWFEGMDMQRQVQMQKAFLATAFGGPGTYTGREMRRAHAGLVQRGIGDPHFDAVLGHLISTLEELGVHKHLRDWARAIAESMRKDVLGR